MKKIISIFMAVMMLFCFASCGKAENNDEKKPADTPKTIGTKLATEFKEIAADFDTSEEIATKLSQNEAVTFSPATMPVEEGMLTGFGNTEIKGFSEGTMFSPMIGTIPFVSYVFVLKDDTDAKEFVSTLESNADMRWNICTEAEEKLVETVDNKVFFIMCPKAIEE